MANVLGAVRLSRMTDESTSPARQREQITMWAKMHGHEVVHITEDTDVSGRVPASMRPELGPWVTEPELTARWDVLVAAKLDRVTRSVKDLCDLIDYCNDRNKVLVSIAESFDLGTPAGRMVATILASVAQFERERIAERRREGAEHLRKKGRYGGGVVPYGYMPDEMATGGWQLVPDPDEAPLVQWAAEQVIAGRSITAVAAELTERGVLTSRGRTRWSDTSLGKILRSPMLTGHVPHNGGVIRDDDGVVVRRDAILTDETWARLQAALARTSKTRTQARSSALIGVLRCGLCGAPLWIQRRTNRPTSYYRCQNALRGKTCTARYIPVEAVEELVTDGLLEKCGDIRMGIPAPIENHSAELAAIQEAIDHMEDQLVSGEISADTWGRAVGRLEKRLAQLQTEQEMLEQQERPMIWSGNTFAQEWADKDDEGRRALLMTHNVQAMARRMDRRAAEEFSASIHFYDNALQSRLASEESKRDVLIMQRGDLEVTLHLGNLDVLRKLLADSTA